LDKGGGAIISHVVVVVVLNPDQVVTVRQLRMEMVGRMMAVSGTITRTSDVRPELYMGSFKCMKCNSDHNHIVQQYTYTTPVCCAQQGGGPCDNTKVMLNSISSP